MKNLKKLFAPTMLAAFFAAMVGTSYATPAAVATTDAYTAYDGATTAGAVDAVDYVLHLEWNGYVVHLEWRGVEEVSAANVLSAAGTDAMFNQ